MRHRGSQSPAAPPSVRTVASATARAAAAVAAFLAVLTASGVAVAIGTSPAAAATNLIANSGFESNLAGWTRLRPPLHLSRSADAHGGRWSAMLSDSSTDTVVLKATPHAVRRMRPGRVFHASAWVKAPDGPVDAVLRIREVKSGRLVGQHLSHLALRDHAWHQIAFDYTTTSSGGWLDFNVLARNLPVGRALLVDDTWLSGPDAQTPSSSPSVAAMPTPGPTSTLTLTPTRTPTMTPTLTPPPPAAGRTLFGSSIYQNPGETFAAAYQRRVRLYGALGVDRVYYPGLPPAWPGNAGYSGGPVIVSFKADPQQVLTGAYDAMLTSWFSSAPRGHAIWWTYYHEPEDQIASGAFTAAQYRAAWQRICDLARSVGNPDLHATLILMCYTLDPSSGRTFADYYPGSAYIDTLGFDCYNTAFSSGSYVNPATQFAAVLSMSAAMGKPYGIAEFGSRLVPGDRGSGRAAWLLACATYLQTHGASWVAYFDSPVAGEYRLLDAPSQQAWRRVVTTM
jgi:hypothetical protein